MSLIEDWFKLCNGEKTYASSHFYTLFHEDFTLDKIQKIFSYFKNAEEMVERYNNYRRPFEVTNDSEILELVKFDLIEKRDFCRIKGDTELVELMTDVSYSFVTVEEFRKLKNSDLPHTWLMELIGDNQIYSYEDSTKNNCIMEAFYGLTTNYNLVWYLAYPLYNSKFNPNIYFEIWKKSRDYILGNNKVFILSNPAPQSLLT